MSLTAALLLDPHRDRRDVWIAYRTDGIAGSGTASDPYNGSTWERFDAVLRSVPEDSILRLGPSPRDAEGDPVPFLTRGYYDGAPADYGWQPKRGQNIIGSGIDVTVLRLTGAQQTGGHYFAIGHPLATDLDHPGTQVNLCEISDLTIDCNLDGQPTDVACGAVRLKGHHARIRRVKAIQWGSRTSARGYVLSVITADAQAPEREISDIGIQESTVVDPAPGSTGGAVLLHAGGNPAGPGSEDAFGEVPFIRHCIAEGDAAHLDRDDRGLSMSACLGGVVEGNSVRDVRIGGPMEEQWGTRSVVVRHNRFRNVLVGPYWKLHGGAALRLEQGLIAQNLIDLAPSPDGVQQPVAILFSNEGPNVVGNLMIRGNTFRCGGGVLPGVAAQVDRAGGVLVRDNRVENAAAFPFQTSLCGHARYQNNRTPAGALVRGYDTVTERSSEELDTEVEDALALVLLEH
jgi:hypothetical protein